MNIAIDFDGTCVTHEYPNIGRNIGAARVLRELVSKGHKIFLWTMRSDQELDAAVRWFEKNNIPVERANVNPDQTEWTSSPKLYAPLYIDDAALGAPLCKGEIPFERPYYDWTAARKLLVELGVL